jgi:hypothetical protein
VTRLDGPNPGIFLFDVHRRGREPLLVVWQERHSFYGEDEPAVPFDWPWSAAHATAVDDLGRTQPVELENSRLRLQVSLTPVFVTAGA